MSSFQGNKCYKNMRVSVRALFILFCLTISTQVKKRRMKRNVTFCSLENLWVLHHKHLLGWHSCARMLSRFSCVRLFATLWTVACQAPLFMGFSRQEYWSGLTCPCSSPCISFLNCSESDQCYLISSLLQSGIQPNLTIIHSLHTAYTFLYIYHCPHHLECHTSPP